MARAVAVAWQGLGATYPNPCVGAAVMVGGRIVAVARSDRTGGPHAEVRALKKAGAAAKGSTLYVTLEPCDHHGRTPPCTTAIIEAQVKRVVIGVRDPASHVAGRGVRRLRRAGIEVVEGVLADECRALHEHYLHHVATGLPFVTLKSAASLDGRIAVRTGDSRWITSEAARKIGHRLRAQHHAIAVGVETVLADDPRLDVRLVQGVSPIPVIFDSKLRLHRAGKRPRLLGPGTIVVHTDRASATARRQLGLLGVDLVVVESDEHGRVGIAAALRALGERTIRSLLVEGGGAMLGAFVRDSAWQRWHWFVAPRILGEGIAAVSGIGWESVADAPRVRVESRRQVGDDLHLVLRPHARER